MRRPCLSIAILGERINQITVLLRLLSAIEKFKNCPIISLNALLNINSFAKVNEAMHNRSKKSCKISGWGYSNNLLRFVLNKAANRLLGKS